MSQLQLETSFTHRYMRFYRRRDPEDIIIPVYLAAVWPGASVGQLGDIRYVYYLDNNTFVKAPGVYAETSGGTVTCQPGQGILTVDTQYEGLIYLTLSYDSTLGQTIETVQGNYYFVIPKNTAFIATSDGIIVATLSDAQTGSAISSYAQSVLFRSMYRLDLETQ